MTTPHSTDSNTFTKTELQFGCSKCGACCSNAPQLTFSEVLDLSDRFFVQLAHLSAISYEKNPMPRDLQEHYSKFCHSFYLPEKKCHLFYFVSFQAVNRPSQPCPQLRDKLCSIHVQKPTFCKIAPLNPMVPEEFQVEFFDKNWLPKIQKQQFLCDLSPQSPTLVKDNKIAQFLQEEDFYDFLTSVRNLTDAYIKYYLDDEARLKEHILQCYERSKDTHSSLFYTSPLDLFQKYYNVMLMDRFVVENFSQNQKEFLQKDIAAALSIKNLNDRTITKLMREELAKHENLTLEGPEDEFQVF